MDKTYLILILGAVLILFVFIISFLVAHKNEKKRQKREFFNKINSLSQENYKRIKVSESGDVILDTLLRNTNVYAKIDEDNTSILHLKIRNKDEEKHYVFSVFDIIDLIQEIVE